MQSVPVLAWAGLTGPVLHQFFVNFSVHIFAIFLAKVVLVHGAKAAGFPMCQFVKSDGSLGFPNSFLISAERSATDIPRYAPHHRPYCPVDFGAKTVVL